MSGHGKQVSRRVLEAVYVLSGLTALVYQVVWQRLLTLDYGVGAVSVSLIVSLFLFGLGIGAELGGHLARLARSPTRTYAAIELVIGIFGLASLPFLSVLGPYLASSHPLGTTLAVAVFLLLPTLCMGATLPLITRVFTRFDPAVASNISHLYFLNTMGAAMGALLASYVLASLLGLEATIEGVAATNVLLGLVVLALGEVPPRAIVQDKARADEPATSGSETVPDRSVPVLLIVAGFLAIAYQMVWFRWVSVLTKDSPYAFSSTLFVYLGGLALGSRLMASRMRKLDPLAAATQFGWLQFLLALAALGGAVMLRQCCLHPASSAYVLHSFMGTAHPAPWDPVTWPHVKMASIFWRFADSFLWPALLFLPATVVMGASFPVAARMRHDLEQSEGAVVGRVYLLTVLGNVMGGLVTGLVLLQSLGSETTVTFLMAAGILFPVVRIRSRPDPARPLSICLGALGLLVVLGPRPGEMVLALHPRPTQVGTEVYWMEGIEGTVVAFPSQDRILSYINGQLHGGYPNLRMYRMAMETMALAPRLTDVMILGFGTGSIMELVLSSPEVKQLRLIEINATLLANLARFPVFRAILTEARVETVIDDARRRMRLDPRRHDVIMMDPLRTTTMCSNNLYSREFFELARDRLVPDGVLMLWLDEQRVLPRTAASVFTHIRRYETFLVASMSPIEERPGRREAVEALLNPAVRGLIEKHVPIQVVTDREGILEQTRGAPINTDLDPVTEYYLGLPWRDPEWKSGGP